MLSLEYKKVLEIIQRTPACLSPSGFRVHTVAHLLGHTLFLTDIPTTMPLLLSNMLEGKLKVQHPLSPASS